MAKSLWSCYVLHWDEASAWKKRTTAREYFNLVSPQVTSEHKILVWGLEAIWRKSKLEDFKNVLFIMIHGLKERTEIF